MGWRIRGPPNGNLIQRTRAPRWTHRSGWDGSFAAFELRLPERQGGRRWDHWVQRAEFRPVGPPGKGFGVEYIAVLHRRALDRTGSVVAGIAREQWTLATPCEGWDVRTLLNHLVAGNLWAAELGAGATIEEVGDRPAGDVLNDDALGAYEASAKLAAATFETPGALDAPRAVLRRRR